MKNCTQQEFEQQLKQLQDDKQSGLTGPFTHSAPAGNMVRGPFKEEAWMVGKETVLMRTWTEEDGWLFFCLDETGGQ